MVLPDVDCRPDILLSKMVSKNVRKSSKKEDSDKSSGYIVTEDGLMVESSEASEPKPRRRESRSLLDSVGRGARSRERDNFVRETVF